MRKLNEFKTKRTSGEVDADELGFTLIELLIASVLALVLMLTTTTILFQALEFADRQRLRPALNDKARETFELLGDGGCCDEFTNNDRHGRLLGMRDRFSFDRDASSLGGVLNEYRLQLDDPIDFKVLTVIGPQISQFTIKCRGDDDPVQGCGVLGNTRTVRGYLARDPRLYVDIDSSGDTSDRSVDDDERGITNRTIETEFMLIQPYQANRARFRSDEVRESYRTIFTFNRSQND